MPMRKAPAAGCGCVRKVFNDKPGEFDPRKYCGPARDLMIELYKHKITEVLGSDNKLANLD